MQNTFQMFGGEDNWIKIQFFSKALINPLIDKFGFDVDIKKVNDDSFILTTKSEFSQGLINWTLSWGDQAKVLSPISLVEEIQHIATNMGNLYKK